MIFAPLSLTAPKGSPIPAQDRSSALLSPLLTSARVSLFAMAFALMPGTAHADFHLCNNTGSRVGIAVGYKDPEGAWVTEGWWNLASRCCETVIKGTIVARLYYSIAIDYDS